MCIIGGDVFTLDLYKNKGKVNKCTQSGRVLKIK